MTSERKMIARQLLADAKCFALEAVRERTLHGDDRDRVFVAEMLNLAARRRRAALEALSGN